MGQPAIYSEALCEKMMACVRSAFGVRPRAGTRWVRVGETTAKTVQNRRRRFAERTILPARRVFRPTLRPASGTAVVGFTGY